MTIPKQAVQEYKPTINELLNELKCRLESPPEPDLEELRLMCDAAIASLPHLQAGYKVKQLEWVDTGQRGFLETSYFAISGTLKHTCSPWEKGEGPFPEHYAISFREHEPRPWELRYRVGNNGLSGLADSFATPEAAKAAAQADYEKRILSALEPSSAREQALEEAAQIAECHSDDRARRYSMDWNDGYIDGCKGAAAAIRALNPQQNTETSAIEKKKFYHNEWPHDALMAARRDGFIDHNGGEAWRYQFTHKDEKGKYDLLYRDTSNSSIQAALPPAQTGGGDE